MKHFLPVLLAGTISARELITGPINKELPEEKPKRKKKATKKLLQTLVNHFAK